MTARASTILIAILILASSLAVYVPVTHCAFINFDDPDYVTDNAHVKAGLSWENVGWALTTDAAGNWHPMTWISHMLDCQVFGLNPARHHLVNAVLHAINSLLLFLVLCRMTRATWRSGFVAALFALHPLHVESVAWVAERKDVLSAFFFMLTLWAYERYAEVRSGKSEVRSRASRFTLRAPRFFLLALVLFALGLTSKPMLVTVPFVLLLLDYWPLQRFDISTLQLFKASAWRLLVEKVPFLALSVGSSIITTIVQQRTIPSMDLLPMLVRLQNALVSYWIYLRTLLFPSGLAAYYPYWPSIPTGLLMLAGGVLLVVSLVCLSHIGSRPYLAVGWLWYLGMLIPVIGIVQVGLQSRADRYTYLPSIGIFIAVAWLLGDLCLKAGRSASWRVYGMVAVLVGVLAILGMVTRAQLHYWKDTQSVFQRAVDVTTDNPIARLNLGSALVEQGRIAEAATHFAEAVRIAPRYPEAQNNLGFTLAVQGRYDDAIAHYRAALEVRPMAKTHYLLAKALAAQGKQREAVAEYRAALELDSDSAGPLNDLAWALATAADAQIRNGVEAVTLAERSCRLTNFKEPLFIGTLAAAYAEAGRFQEAVKTAEQARDLAAGAGNKDLAEKNRELLELYRAGKAFHEQGN